MRECAGVHVEASAERLIVACRGRRHVARQHREGVTLLTGWSSTPFMTAARGKGACVALVLCRGCRVGLLGTSNLLGDKKANNKRHRYLYSSAHQSSKRRKECLLL